MSALLDAADAIAAVERATPRSALHSAAQWYAANFGWPVFPLHSVRDDGRCTCGEYPCGTDNRGAGKHPRTRSGCLDASLDPDVIAGWWRRWPDAGVAIATGRGLVVVDIDPAHGGDDGLVDLRRSLGELPATVECLTGGGGRHLYFAAQGLPVRNAAGFHGAPGVDVRGEGGYVVAPPSRHASGGVYRWEASGDPDDVDLAAIPPNWRDAMTAQQQRGPASRGAKPRDGAPVDPIPAGQRNVTLTRMAGHLRAAGFELDEIAAALLAVNGRRCVPPLTEREVARIAESIHARDPGYRDPGATLPVTSELAPPEDIDRAYRVILDALTLSPEHREALCRTGFGDAAVAASGARSLPVEGRARLASAVVAAIGEDAARRVPGIVRVEEHGRAWWSLAGPAGIVVPLRDGRAEGDRVAALLAGAEGLHGGRIVGSAQRGGPGGIVVPHLPQRARELLDAGAARAVVVVGALRAELATARLNLPCVGAPGLDGWRLALDALTRWSTVARVAVVLNSGATATATERETSACREAIAAAGLGFDRFNAGDFDSYLAARGAAERGAA